MKVNVTAIKTYKTVFYALKEKKSIFQYDCWTKRITAEIPIIDMKDTIPTGFAYIQNASNRLFITGGTRFARQCYELILTEDNQFKR